VHTPVSKPTRYTACTSVSIQSSLFPISSTCPCALSLSPIGIANGANYRAARQRREDPRETPPLSLLETFHARRAFFLVRFPLNFNFYLNVAAEHDDPTCQATPHHPIKPLLRPLLSSYAHEHHATRPNEPAVLGDEGP